MFLIPKEILSSTNHPEANQTSKSVKNSSPFGNLNTQIVEAEAEELEKVALIYPNPFTSNFQIVLNSDKVLTNLEIIDLQGRILHIQAIEKNTKK